jgi:hypothetical protein
LQHGGDAAQIEATVLALAVLDVVADEFHPGGLTVVVVVGLILKEPNAQGMAIGLAW